MQYFYFKCFIFIFIHFVCVRAIRCHEANTKPDQLFIDNLRTEYLAAEENLWEIIKNNFRNISIISRIRNVHQPFVDKMENHQIIWQKLIKIQRFNTLIPFWHLHQLNDSAYLEKLSTNVIDSSLNRESFVFYQNCADAVYNVSMHNTFWWKIDYAVDVSNNLYLKCSENFSVIHHSYYLFLF